MTLPHILDVPLQPPGIPYACSSCYNEKAAPYHTAKHWLVAPDGIAVQTVCEKHGQAIRSDFSAKLNEDWTLHPIWHEDSKDRTWHKRGPICGHSVCSQNFIDNGDNSCHDASRKS